MQTRVETLNVSVDYGSLGHMLERSAFFLAAPFIGLAYAVSYGTVGLAGIFCYGLKAFGVKCGLMKR